MHVRGQLACQRSASVPVSMIIAPARRGDDAVKVGVGRVSADNEPPLALGSGHAAAEPHGPRRLRVLARAALAEA
jgi:hypothetical protein